MTASFRTIISSILLVAFIFLPFHNYSQDNKQKLSQQEQATIKSHQKLVDQYISQDNFNQAARYLNKMAYIYWQKEHYEDAARCFEKSLEMNKKLGNKNALRMINTNMGMIYTDCSKYNKSLEAYQQSLAISRESNKRDDIAADLINVGNIHNYMGNYQKAVDALDEALVKAQELNNLKLIRGCYGGLAENYKQLGQSEKSMEYFELFSSFDHHIKSEEMKQREVEARIKVAKAQAEKKAKQLELELQTAKLQLTADSLEKVEKISLERQVKLLQQEKEIQDLAFKEQEAQLKTAKIIRNTFIAVFIIILIFSGLLFREYSAKKKANKQLEKQNILLENQNITLKRQKDEIEEQRKELAKKNKQIMDSINYASRIQDAILPSKKAIKENIPESFIFYRPKDIVSGDFYWFSKQGNKLFLAAVDCTGHSVPGAFMSMIGNTLLNEIVNEKKVFQPSKILAQLNTGVINALKQEDEDGSQDDGMDISFCCLDFDAKEIQLASGNHHIHVIQNDKIDTVQGDIFSIGGMFSMRRNLNFTNHVIPMVNGTSIYMFSDGYQDQFGGPEGRKFMSKQLKDILFDNRHLPMAEQHSNLENTFDLWRGEKKQLDDVLLIGIKIEI